MSPNIIDKFDGNTMIIYTIVMDDIKYSVSISKSNNLDAPYISLIQLDQHFGKLTKFVNGSFIKPWEFGFDEENPHLTINRINKLRLLI